MTPYYEDALVTLYHGDCRVVLPLLGLSGVCADVCVTDPPYGVGKAEWDGAFPTEWIAAALLVAPRLLVMPGNTALIRAGAAFGDLYRDCIVLHAANGMTRSRIAFGNWIPVLAIGDWSWKPRPNYLRFNVSLTEKIDHPSPKPYNAMTALLAHYSEPTWTVLDPFAGSGTTLVAAKALGRRAVGIEQEERYCEIIVRRLAQETLELGA